MLKAIALETDFDALSSIKEFCNGIDLIDLRKTFTSPEEALRYIKKFPVDLILIKCEMATLSGIHFYQLLTQQIMAVFMSAQPGYAVEAFECGAIDYLLIPFTYDRFLNAIKKAAGHFNFFHSKSNSLSQNIFLRSDYKLVKVNVDEINFIESTGDYLKIHRANEKPIVTKMTMKTILEKLPQDEFVRIHRSYSVRLNKITCQGKNKILIDKINLPIGFSYRHSLKKILI